MGHAAQSCGRWREDSLGKHGPQLHGRRHRRLLDALHDAPDGALVCLSVALAILLNLDADLAAATCVRASMGGAIRSGRAGGQCSDLPTHHTARLMTLRHLLLRPVRRVVVLCLVLGLHEPLAVLAVRHTHKDDHRAQGDPGLSNAHHARGPHVQHNEHPAQAKEGR